MADKPGVQSYTKDANLTSDQLSRHTETAQAQASQHDFSCEISMRGDCHLNPTLSLTLTGTNSKFDRTYSILQVVHRFSASAGYMCEVVGHAPDDSGSASTSPDNTSDQSQPPPAVDAFGDTQPGSAADVNGLGKIGNSPILKPFILLKDSPRNSGK
jgi:hypothetical protein